MRCFVLATVLLLLAGCGNVGRLVGPGTFNAGLLLKGGIVIGGVSSALPLTPQQSIEYAEALQRVFQRYAPALSVVGSREVYTALGRNLFSQMLDSYNFHETGSTVFMNLLHEKFPKARYVVYARIEDNKVRYGNVKPKDGQGLILQTLRGMAVSMRVFDLHARQLQVWAAGTQQAETSERRVFGNFSEEKLKSLFPRPPELKTVFDKNCNILVAELTASRKK